MGGMPCFPAKPPSREVRAKPFAKDLPYLCDSLLLADDEENGNCAEDEER